MYTFSADFFFKYFLAMVESTEAEVGYRGLHGRTHTHTPCYTHVYTLTHTHSLRAPDPQSHTSLWILCVSGYRRSTHPPLSSLPFRSYRTKDLGTWSKAGTYLFMKYLK